MRKRLIASLLVLGVVAAACGDDGDDDDAQTPDDEGTEVTEPADDGTDDEGTEVTEPADDGTDDEVTETTEPEDDASANMDPDGVLRTTYDLVSSARGGVQLDPAASGASTGDLPLHHWIYGGLMRREPDGTLVPDLAEEVTAVDGNTIEIVLREGLTLSDGTPFDADLVEAALARNLEQEGVPAFGSDFFKLSEIEVTSPTSLELTIPDGTAAGWRDIYIAGMEMVPVPPDTDFGMPIGAGPFTVAEFVPEERVVLEKNPEYWDADSINLARVELVHAPDPQTAASALSAGQVDWALLDVPTIDAVGSEFEVDPVPNPDFISSMLLCKSEEPLDDPQVRQALSMAIDREAINEALFNGLGAPAWDLWPEDHPLHNPDLTGHYEYDPDGARELLAEAGHPDGFTFESLPIPSGGMPEMAQVIQQQFADIGVTMNISQSSNFVEDLYLNRTVPSGFVPSMGEAGIGKLRQWVGESIGNFCGYDDPELASLVEELASVSADSDEAVELWYDIQEIVVEDVLSILIAFQPRVTAHNPDAVGSVEAAWYAVPVPDLYNMWMTG